MYPSSLAQLLPNIPEFVGLLFRITALTAIVNIYSVGDTLVPHRSISEPSPAALASVWLGCGSPFIAGVGEK